MPDSARDAKGQAKEKLGEVTGNEDTRREGQAEQAGEKLKSGVDGAVDKLKGALGRDEK